MVLFLCLAAPANMAGDEMVDHPWHCYRCPSPSPSPLRRPLSLTDIQSFIFFGFLVAGEEIENPFGYDKNDLVRTSLPLRTYTLTN